MTVIEALTQAYGKDLEVYIYLPCEKWMSTSKAFVCPSGEIRGSEGFVSKRFRYVADGRDFPAYFSLPLQEKEVDEYLSVSQDIDMEAGL